MYEVALTVAACLRSGTRVDVAWVVGSDLSPADPGGALAITPGGGRVGSLYGGALDQQLVEQAQALGDDRGRLVTVSVGELEAPAFGLTSGGNALAVVMPASLLATDIWAAFLDRRSVRLHLTRDGDELTAAGFGDAEAEPGSLVSDDEVTTTWRPVPTVVLAGGGPVLQALERMAPALGWRVQRTPDPDTARGLVVGLGPLDSVVLAMHDVELAGPVLASTLRARRGTSVRWALEPRSGAARPG